MVEMPLVDVIAKTKKIITDNKANPPHDANLDLFIGELGAHAYGKISSPQTDEKAAVETIPQPEGPVPAEFAKADIETLRFLDWDVRIGRHETTEKGKKIKKTPFENFLKSLWNFSSENKNNDMLLHFLSMTDLLKKFGFHIHELPSKKIYSNEAVIMTEPLGIGLRLPEGTERLGVFPEAIPPIEKMWDKIQFKETMDIDKKPHFFLVLDIDFKEWWKTQPEPIGEFMQLYLENATKFAGDLKVSVGIHLKGVSNRDEFKKAFNLKVSDENFDRLFSTGLTRNTLNETKLFEDAGEVTGSEHINRTFDLQQRVARSPRFREMFHGWTGIRDTGKADQIFNQAAACDEFSSDDAYDATLLLLMSGLGNEGTHSELLPDNFLKPEEDDSTQPKHYAKEMITLLDMMGFWGKKIIESGHSMGGAAKYWFINDMLARAEEFGIEKPPQLIAWAENPALPGVNIFLEEFNGVFIQTGMLTKLITEQIGKDAISSISSLSEERKEQIYNAIADKVVGKILERIAAIFTKLRLVKEEQAEDTALIHSIIFSMISEQLAVRQETNGLLNQENFVERMIRRLNSQKVFLGAVIGEKDLLCAASRPRNGELCGQIEKFEDNNLIHPVIEFEEGHFTHLLGEYQELFCRYILPLAGVLNPDEMNQLFNALKIISPITELSTKFNLKQPAAERSVNRKNYWKHDDPSQRMQEIEERLVPFLPDAVKNNPVLIKRAMEFVMAIHDKIHFPAISEKDVLLLAKAENILDMRQREDGTYEFVRDDVEFFNRNLVQGYGSDESKRICDEVLGKLFNHPEQVRVYRLPTYNQQTER